MTQDRKKKKKKARQCASMLKTMKLTFKKKELLINKKALASRDWPKKGTGRQKNKGCHSSLKS